jgi:hypothetical protein
MLRLKSRSQSPPGGFLFKQSQTGWENWKVDEPSKWDFKRLCQILQQHRQANPQYHLNTDMTSIEAEVDYANALRVSRLPNTESYVATDGAPPPKTQAPALRLHLLAAVKKVSAGARTILDFEESGEPPVSAEQALRRAKVCAGDNDDNKCPCNETGDLTRFFTIPASETIKAQLGRAHEMNLTTPLDDRINICGACLCPLKLKVWFPLKFIYAHMDGETLNALDSGCWILSEIQAAAVQMVEENPK